ncbi:DUF1294 domain-containing protein [Vibrio diazotrophicus]|uniref:DUF1294 domain-containing protein n=1 Tax=Vibrio diazotrophicus TaxID=685 RepID=UPI00142E7ACF|nr:DUF1294 domain-containing protein [Vibrio diazotrophicus]NIY91172.1 DUF1294 domain-containing protein [Vibrio diazotrophicus]
MALKGTISEWYIDRGYGYIIPDSGALRIKFLLSDVKNSVNIGEIKQPVRFVIAQDENGNRRATHVEGVRTFPWATLIVVWFAATLAGCVYFWQYPKIIVYYYLGATAIVLAVYLLDKRNEKRTKAVTGESALLFLSALGGWPGAVIGQYSFNLQPKSFTFQLLFFIVMSLHIAFLVWSLTPEGSNQLHEWMRSFSVY